MSKPKVLALGALAAIPLAIFAWAQSRRRPVVISAFVADGQCPQYTVRDGQPVQFTWAWEAATKAHCRAYVNAVAFSLRIDGRWMDLAATAPALTETPNTCVARWRFAAQRFAEGSHQVEMVTTLGRQVSDGIDRDGDGKPDTFGPGAIIHPPLTLMVR